MSLESKPLEVGLLRDLLKSLDAKWTERLVQDKPYKKYCIRMEENSSLIRLAENGTRMNVQLRITLGIGEEVGDETGPNCLEKVSPLEGQSSEMNPSLIVMGVCCGIFLLFVAFLSILRIRKRYKQRRFDRYTKPGMFRDWNLQGNKAVSVQKKEMLSRTLYPYSTKSAIALYVDSMDTSTVNDRQQRLEDWIDQNHHLFYLNDTTLPLKTFNKFQMKQALQREKSKCKTCTCSNKKMKVPPVTYESRFMPHRLQKMKGNKSWDFTRLDIPDEEEIIGEDICHSAYQSIDLMRTGKEDVFKHPRLSLMTNTCQSEFSLRHGQFPHGSRPMNQDYENIILEENQISDELDNLSQLSTQSAVNRNYGRLNVTMPQLKPCRSKSFDDINFSKNMSLMKDEHGRKSPDLQKPANGQGQRDAPFRKTSFSNLSFYHQKKPSEYLTKAVQDIVKKHYECYGFRKVPAVTRDSNESILHLGNLRKHSTIINKIPREIKNRILRSKSTCCTTNWNRESAQSIFRAGSTQKKSQKQRRFTFAPENNGKIPFKSLRASLAENFSKSTESISPVIQSNVQIQLTRDSPSPTGSNTVRIF